MEYFFHGGLITRDALNKEFNCIVIIIVRISERI